MDAELAATFATLQADVAQLRSAVTALAEGQQDAVSGLAVLDKNHAVAVAKADIRAGDLAEVRRLVDDIAVKLVPVTVYFDAQGKAIALAEANRANAWSYATPTRIALAISVFAALAGWLRGELPRATAGVQESADAGTVDP